MTTAMTDTPTGTAELVRRLRAQGFDLTNEAAAALEEAERVIAPVVESSLEADGNERPDWCCRDDNELIPSMPFDLTVGDFRALRAWLARHATGSRKAMFQSCSMGVGCDEAGTCYAAAHGEPERCPKGASDDQ